MNKLCPEIAPSPITGNMSKLVKSFSVSDIIQYYKIKLGYDVQYLFDGINNLGLYCCPDTDYLFFFPGIEGDGHFYSQKKKNAASYMDWKWEHEEALRFISDNETVLEVGSGAGGFLDGLTRNRKVFSCGLELNPAAIQAANERGIIIYNEMLHQHSLNHLDFYDVICSYQVLEHINDVKDFMISSFQSLKLRGKLIISVPDNDSFVGELDAFSNMPPYHVGRYSFDSLEKIGNIFGFKMIYKSKEPLQRYHYSTVESLIFKKVFGNNKYLNRIILNIGGRWIVHKMVKSSATWMNGHSIFMVFSK